MRSVGFNVVHTNIFLVYLSNFYVVFDLNWKMRSVLKSLTPMFVPLVLILPQNILDMLGNWSYTHQVR